MKKNAEWKNDYIKVICDAFYSTKAIVNYVIPNHRLDLYLEDINVIVEFSEELDKQREERIIEYLADQARIEDEMTGISRNDFDYKKWIRFIRIGQGELGHGIRTIAQHVHDNLGSCPYDYMDAKCDFNEWYEQKVLKLNSKV